MENLVILNNPLLLVLYGLALACMLFELFTKLTGYVLPLIAFAIAVGASIYALILGAQLLEVTIVLLVFLLINLFGARRKSP